MESDVRVFLFEQGFLFGKGNCFNYTTQDGLVSHPSASGEQGTWLLSVREAIIILVALNAQYCIAPRQVPPRVYIWLSGETTGFFRLILVSLSLSLHRFLFLARRTFQVTLWLDSYLSTEYK